MDKAVVVQRTFTKNDFSFEKDIVTVQASKILTSLKDLKEEDKPIIEFERNASKATKTSGILGRGIVLRISPRERMDKAGSKANNLRLSYDDIM